MTRAPGKALRRNLTDYGLKATVAKAGRWLAMPLAGSVTYCLYAMDLSATVVPQLDAGEIEFRFLTESDTDLIAQAESIEEWLAGKLSPKLKGGSLCLAALAQGRVVGFNLVSSGRVEVPPIRGWLTFDQTQAWSEQISTHHDWRRRGIARGLRYRMITELGQRGVRWFYGGTLRGNDASLALARRVGFSVIGDIKFRKFLSRRQWRYISNGDEDAGFDTRPFHGLGRVSVDELPVQ